MASNQNMLALTADARLLQLALERSGVAGWNQWIGQLFDSNLICTTWGSKPAPPLSVFLDFGETDFSQTMLDGINLSHAWLEAADFSAASLRRAQLGIVRFARFTGADLRDAKFEIADVSGCDFIGAQLGGTTFKECSYAKGFAPSGLPTDMLQMLTVTAKEDDGQARVENEKPADLLIPASLLSVGAK